MRRAAQFFLFLLIVLSCLAYLRPTAEPQLDEVMQSPMWRHWFGTDHLGRDLFWRVMQGNFFSWVVGLFAFFVSLIIGSFLGFWAGWRKNYFDFIFMRLLEIFESVPQLVLVTIFVLMLRPWAERNGTLRILSLSLGIGFTHWSHLARLMRTLVLQESESSYIEGARVLGASSMRIFVWHLWPNLWPTLRSSFWVQLPSFLLFESLLSFLGFGLQPPQTSLGSLIFEGWKTFSTAPHLLLAPGFVLFLTLLSIQTFSEEKGFPRGEIG